MARPLKGAALASRSIQPSKPRPLLTRTRASSQGARIGRARLIGVGVDIGADQGGDLGQVAPHFGHEVAQDREGRDGFGLGLC